jgi:hypothetical protein
MSEKNNQIKKENKSVLKKKHNKRVKIKKFIHDNIDTLKKSWFIISVLSILIALAIIVFLFNQWSVLPLKVAGIILLIALILISIPVALIEAIHNPALLIISIVLLGCYSLFDCGAADQSAFNLIICTFILESIIIKQKLIPQKERELRNVKFKLKKVNGRLNYAAAPEDKSERHYIADEFLCKRQADLITNVLRLYVFSIVILPVISYNIISKVFAHFAFDFVSFSDLVRPLDYCVTSMCLFAGIASIILYASKESRITSEIIARKRKMFTDKDMEKLSCFDKNDIIYVDIEEEQILYKIPSEMNENEEKEFTDHLK